MKLYPASYLRKRSLHAQDGEIGRCTDFLFDEESWIVRYFVVDTRKWLPGRKVVVATSSVGNGSLLDEDGLIRTRLRREQIKDSPPIAEHAPVSMEVEAELSAYYGWPVYWDAGNPWGNAVTAPPFGPERNLDEGAQENGGAPDTSQQPKDTGQSRLRSAHRLQGYHLEARDGPLGHIEDFVFAPDSWLVELAVLNTRNWLPGRDLAFAPGWITEIDAIANRATVDRDRAVLERCPRIDLDEPLSAEEVADLRAAIETALG
ncbi:MAG: hypothetical protein ACLFR7_10735 [Opitutales bacterium]